MSQDAQALHDFWTNVQDNDKLSSAWYDNQFKSISDTEHQELLPTDAKATPLPNENLVSMGAPMKLCSRHSMTIRVSGLKCLMPVHVNITRLRDVNNVKPGSKRKSSADHTSDVRRCNLQQSLVPADANATRRQAPNNVSSGAKRPTSASHINDGRVSKCHRLVPAAAHPTRPPDTNTSTVASRGNFRGRGSFDGSGAKTTTNKNGTTLFVFKSLFDPTRYKA